SRGTDVGVCEHCAVSLPRHRLPAALIALAVAVIVTVATLFDRPAIAESAVLLVAVWVFGTAVLGSRPPAERLIVGFMLVLALAWVAMAQPLVGVSIVGHQAVMRPLVCAALLGLGWWRRDDVLSITWDPLPTVV